MTYKQKIGCFIEANWNMGRNDVIDGACNWAEEADKEIADRQHTEDANTDLILKLTDELEANKKLIYDLRTELLFFIELIKRGSVQVGWSVSEYNRVVKLTTKESE